ncbi:hypothetical protein L1049_012156 [Liquidambar formosana]|uniref:Uncharacterized protein n=1 Tax=Liquidambar formosana TaxID=63359 RepID=A0AAP0X0C3_LIQFO
MDAKENYPELVDQEHTDLQDLDAEAAEETLSLCDLPIYNDAAEWDDFSKEDKNSSEDHEEFFEFLNQDFTASTLTPAENIIFCGKLIPHKPPVSEKTHKLESKPDQNPKKRGLFRWKSSPFAIPRREAHPKKRFLFRWKSASFNRLRIESRSDGVRRRCTDTNRNKYSKLQQVSGSKSFALPGSEKYDIPVRKVSILTSPAKSKSNLFMFGLLMRVPTEMELSDIRNRQQRRIPSMRFSQSFDRGEEVTVGKREGKGFWRLLRSSLGFGSHHANTVVKASFGCIPPL